MAEPLLAVERLRKSYGALVVSDDVTFDVRAGKLHTLIGPNGAGKTSLINQLSGTLASDAGAVRLDGVAMTPLGIAERVRHGIVRSFQITSVLAGFSALENVALAVQARSGSSFRFWAPAAREVGLNAQAMAALDRVGLAARAGVLAGLLSHGEKRLLELAIALARRPKLLLLDEPLAGLGREESADCIALLRRLKSETTILLVEHDMDAVFALADRISVLVAGRVIATGPPAAISANGAVRAAYLGEAAA